MQVDTSSKRRKLFDFSSFQTKKKQILSAILAHGTFFFTVHRLCLVISQAKSKKHCRLMTLRVNKPESRERLWVPESRECVCVSLSHVNAIVLYPTTVLNILQTVKNALLFKCRAWCSFTFFSPSNGRIMRSYY